LRNLFTHSVYALLLLGGSMGASPWHTKLASSGAPAATPATQQAASVSKPHTKPYQVGTASWYGDYFQGRPTASGEDFDMYDLSAAHLKLPLGTYVRVTNLSNHRSVVVRVNDRGPYVDGRVIDLSYAAARSIGMSRKGLQRVRIDIVEAPHKELAMASKPVIPH
jgi:rare lipoprotein A